MKQELQPQPQQITDELKLRLPIIIREKTLNIKSWVQEQSQALKVLVSRSKTRARFRTS